MLASISNALGFTFGPAKLIATIVATVITKDQPMLIKNGISYKPFLFKYAVNMMFSWPKRPTA
jgi:hypothetical protein